LLPGLQYNLPADSVEGEAMAVELRLEHQLAQCCLSRSSTAGRAVSVDTSDRKSTGGAFTDSVHGTAS